MFLDPGFPGYQGIEELWVLEAWESGHCEDGDEGNVSVVEWFALLQEACKSGSGILLLLSLQS